MLDTSHDFGRPISACQIPDDIDKWHVLNDLTRAGRIFGLGHRTLGVLKALMTFLPGRRISPNPRSAIVFPSNRTLSDRLNGMPESTLRRHLAALVASGFVTRQDSPNRKRFARRVGGAGGIAFGFDLSALARAAADIAQAAEAETRHRETQAALRAEINALCQELDAVTQQPIRRALRRKDNLAELEVILVDLRRLTAKEMSATDTENERHIQDTEKKDSVSTADNPELAELRDHCKEALSFFPGTLKCWDSAILVSRQIAGMIGIETPVVQRAEQHMGSARAATTILCMLERLSTIRNPGGYLRKLTQLAQRNQLDVNAMISGRKGGCIVS